MSEWHIKSQVFYTIVPVVETTVEIATRGVIRMTLPKCRGASDKFCSAMEIAEGNMYINRYYQGCEGEHPPQSTILWNWRQNWGN